MRHATSDEELLFAEDALIANAQFVIHNLMVDRDISRADLARALGVSESRVSQMFSDAAPNLTLRTVARVFRVLGEECRVTSDRWESILEAARQNDRGESEPAPRLKRPHFELPKDFFEVPHHSEMSWLKEEAPPSNDNTAVEALVA